MGDVVKFKPKKDTTADNGEIEQYCCPHCDCLVFELYTDGICCIRCREFIEMPE
jgi:hypothetical protein